MQINPSRRQSAVNKPPTKSAVAVESGQVVRAPAATSSMTTPEWLSYTQTSQSKRYFDWASLGDAQYLVAKAQSASLCLIGCYQKVQQLRKGLVPHQNRRRTPLRFQLSDITSDLTSDLYPRVLLCEAQKQSDFVMDQVDLLAAKDGAEEISLCFFGAGRFKAQIVIAAGMAKEQVLAQINTCLSDIDVSVLCNDLGQLRLSVSSDKQPVLSEPIGCAGQGFRIPAGNPIAIRLTPEINAVERFIKRIDDSQSFKQLDYDMALCQREIKKSLKNLRDFISQLIEPYNSIVQSTQDIDSINQLSDDMTLMANAKSYEMLASFVAAQTNIPSRNIVFLLKGPT
jgi:hypothetical protein